MQRKTLFRSGQPNAGVTKRTEGVPEFREVPTFATAAEALEIIEDGRPEEGFPYFIWGLALRDLGQFDEAVAALETSIDLQPTREAIAAYVDAGVHESRERLR